MARESCLLSLVPLLKLLGFGFVLLAETCAPRPPAAPAAAYPCTCIISANGEREAERAACLRSVGDAHQMRPEIMQSLALTAHAPPFEADSSCGIFWVRADGRAMPTLLFDNGADYFCEGLTRYVRRGKYGYMNAKLEVVVPPLYDFAYPVRDGHGKVCRECTFTPSEGHTSVDCARCGVVDKAGKLIVPLTHSSSEIWTMFPNGDDDRCSSSAAPD